MAGAVAVPVNTRFTDSEAAYVIEDSGSAFVFETGQALLDGSPHVYDGTSKQDVAAIFYTSGTTGFPKGAMHTHENVLANVETAIRVVEIDRELGRAYRTLVVVPLFHVTGCHSQTLPALRIGGFPAPRSTRATSSPSRAGSSRTSRCLSTSRSALSRCRAIRPASS
jgi:long-chain acyl-CoA synthetase